MAKTPKMQSWIHQDQKSKQIFVIIEHGERQSYSRAVMPKMKRDVVAYLQSTGQHLVTYIEDASYGHHVRNHEDRPLTIYTLSYIDFES